MNSPVFLSAALITAIVVVAVSTGVYFGVMIDKIMNGPMPK